MRFRDGFDPETGEKIRIFDLEIPTSSDMVSGNVWGWNKTKPKARWFFRILLSIALIGIFVQVISVIALLQK